MPEQYFNQYAFYWIGAFILLFAVVKLVIARHSYFQLWSDAHKSIAVKGISLSAFVLIYIVVSLLSVRH